MLNFSRRRSDELDIVQDYPKLFVSKEASSVPRGRIGAQAVGLAAAIETKTNKSALRNSAIFVPHGK